MRAGSKQSILFNAAAPRALVRQMESTSRDPFAILAACGCGRTGCTLHKLAWNAFRSRAVAAARCLFFSDLAFGLGKDPTGKDVLIKYGAFIQNIFDFLIIAFVLFCTIKFINRLKKPPVEPAAEAAAPPRQEVLLEEIRDLLAKRA